MESNNITIVLACLASVSALVVACVTAYFNRQTAHGLEIVKFQSQKQHTKFLSFHVKQVEVLSKIFQLCSKANSSIYKVGIMWGVKDVVSQYEGISNDEVKKVSYLKFYNNNSENLLEELRRAKQELESYFEENLVFINNTSLENHLRDIISLLLQLSTVNIMSQVFIDSDGSETPKNDVDYVRHFEYLDSTFKHTETLLPQILTEIRLEIKKIID
jgi:hypothetical protein